MLKFIGTGSAFNTKLGNNGAYIKKGKALFMIDCGSSTFHRLLERGVLKGVEKIYVLITHTHPDHIGSLGDLIFYGYYAIEPIMKPKVLVLSPFDINVRGNLHGQGVTDEVYAIHTFSRRGTVIEDDDLGAIGITPHRVEHVPELNCYGYSIIIEDEDVEIYYSGDSNMIPENVLNNLHEYDFFYQDTCKADYEGNVHLSLRRLCELIPEELRSKVYCMHLDGTFDIAEAESLGFNVVRTE